MYQKSLIILKPDAIQRRLVGRILQRFEDCGLKIHAVRFQRMSKRQAKIHYREHVKKNYYPRLEEYMTSGPVLIAILGGMAAIDKIRLMIGDTFPARALPGTIRGDLAHQCLDPNAATKKKVRPVYNLIHASETIADAAREIKMWFGDDRGEICDYSFFDDPVLGSDDADA